MRRLKRSRRAQATSIGAILFFTIAMILIGFLYEVYNTQATMNQFDAERSQERIAISNVLFGNTQTYSEPNSTTVTVSLNETNDDPLSGIILSKNTTGTSFVIPNMNFTDDADGWTLTKTYYGDGTAGASGGFTSDTPSPGGVFIDFAHTPPEGEYDGVNMSWSTRFYVNLETVGVLNNIFLSYSSKCTIYNGVNFSQIEIFLKDPDNVEHHIYDRTITSVDSSWITYGGISIDTGNFSESGWYKLILKVQAELTYLATSAPEIKIYFDDIGIGMVAFTHITDWYGTLIINEDTALITQLDASYSGHYNKTLVQYLYVYNVAEGEWELFDGSTASTLTKTVKETYTGTDVQNYIYSNGTIKVRVYAFSNSTFECGAEELTLDDFYTGSTDKITLSFTNTGGINVRIISLWIIDASNNHYHYDLDLALSPGGTTVQVIDHSWSFGGYTFKAITDKGTVTTYEETA